MSDAPALPPKKEVMLALLEGTSVYLHLDPRREGVLVPKWLAAQPQLVLQVGLNMAVRIPDLDVDEDGVSCTLSFNRSPFWCRMPWTAIYGLVGEDGRGMIWPEDVPVELTAPQRPRPKLEAVRADTRPRKRRSAPASAPAPAPVLVPAPAPVRDAIDASVPVEPTEPTDATPSAGGAPEPDPATPGKRKLPPYLRIVK